MIKLLVIGNLGRDAVINTVNGRNVINFNVAHTERFKDSQGVQRDRTIWVDCAYWTDRTAVAPYLKKGTQVYVEGFPDVRTYTTQDGRQGASITLRVASVQLLGSRQTDNSITQPNQVVPPSSEPQPSSSEPQTPSIPPAGEITEPLDDLPF